MKEIRKREEEEQQQLASCLKFEVVSAVGDGPSLNIYMGSMPG
jgi:hypothetical protein